MNWKLETERLFLREFIISDAQHMFALNSVPEQIEYTGDIAFDSEKEARNFLEEYKDYSLNGFGRWACISKEANEWIGWCGLKKHKDGAVDLGYRFFKQFWGKGFATESAKACLQYGFEVLHLERIIARTDKRNLASIRVIEKIGMHYWKQEDVDHIKDALIFKIDKS